ncbi:hypothetical protein N7445_006461 [Penicillium cf. griseofulvum]|nr:hypothetical protein N7445_006461 [Penicillium cf. griseofulvum]
MSSKAQTLVMASGDEFPELPAAFHHPGWYEVPEPVRLDGLASSRAQNRNKWTVKLQFKQGGDTRTGTGFYINIPDTDLFVILTAGHNLIDDQGSLSKELEVLHQPEAIVGTYISPEYRKQPTEQNAINDYGAILQRKPDNRESRGFGFALQLAFERLRGQKLDVVGYGELDDPGDPKLDTGKCIFNGQDQRLEYDVGTRKGLSGSPVFMPYKGHETVVAIHNHGPKMAGRGSRGTRLNLKVLLQIFEWAGILHRDKCLKVFNKTRSPKGDELYLRFTPGRKFARVQKGQNGLETSFDVFPAYAPASSLPTAARYVFRYKQASISDSKEWVRWDVLQQRVRPTSQVEEACFPQIKYDKDTQKYPNVFRVLFPDQVKEKGNDKVMELRMDASLLRDEDIEVGKMDVPGISFGKYYENKSIPFDDFCLM